MNSPHIITTHILMNHLIDIKGQRYVLRQHPQKLTLLTFPHLALLHHLYLASTYCYLNAETQEILIIYQNEISILKVAVAPLQLTIVQQSFVEWEPLGGILMSNSVVLYGVHSIIFYSRATIMEKMWEIDILQQIEDIRSNRGDSVIALRATNPPNTLLLWRTAEPSLRPAQEITLTLPILQWKLVGTNILAILTESEVRVYYKNRQQEYCLHQFYQLAGYRSFTWIGSTSPASQSRQSVNSLLLMGHQGQCTLIELFAVEQRTLLSQLKEIGKFKLDYKGVNMRRVVGGWGAEGKLNLLAETKNKQVFGFIIDRTLKVESRFVREELLGAEVTDMACKDKLILARDRTRWKYYHCEDSSNFRLLDQIDCERAFIGDEKKLYYIQEQQLFVRLVGYPSEQQPKPVALKYADPLRVYLMDQIDGNAYFAVGIRFYKLTAEMNMTAVGFAIRNQKAVLMEVSSYAKTLLYKIGEQYLLLQYKIVAGKVATSSIKSSAFPCSATKTGRWIEQAPQEIRVGSGDRLITAFSLTKLYKILDVQIRDYGYVAVGIYGNGITLIIRNYAFFLQLVEDERGSELVLLKRLNQLLYHRFSPRATPLKLIDASVLAFWAGNTFIKLGCRVGLRSYPDPYSLPDTLLGKQLDLRKIYHPHHPKLLQSLLQCSRIDLLLQLLRLIHTWFLKPNHTLAELYQVVNPQWIGQCLKSQGEDNLSLMSEKRRSEDSEFLQKFAAQLLDNIEAIQLRENNPFIVESLLESLTYFLRNPQAVDYYSQAILIGIKTPFLKGKKFTSMQIVHLVHSLNKDEAVAQLKPEKMSWDWIRDYSLPFWGDNKQNLKKWIEEVAANQYRANKEPFDCLFWYLLVGKKSLLITLFKNHKLNSKQHEAIFNFLQRDFSIAKDRTAAIKNAYVLIDKKRYLHAMAFFILGNGFEDCIRLCVDRLKDLNLAYTFVLLFKDAPSKYLLEQMHKGDVWFRHLANRIAGSHILSYNCLFQRAECEGWTYLPELTGFHPSLSQFAQRLLHSVPVRRQLQAQNAPPPSQDIFADFYQQETVQSVVPVKQKIQIIGDDEQLQKQCVQYYLRQGLPLLALGIDPNNADASQSYEFSRYKLSGEVQASMMSTVIGLEDKVGIVKCYLNQHKYAQMISYLRELSSSFSTVFSAAHFVEIIATRKHTIGELLHNAYHCEQLLPLIETQSAKWGQFSQNIQTQLRKIKQLVLLSKIYVCILLKHYEYLVDLLSLAGGRANYDNVSLEGFWTNIKIAYDNLHEPRKEKYVKQMDDFQHAFIATKRKDDQPPLREDLEMMVEEGILLHLRLLILTYLTKLDTIIKPQLSASRKMVEDYLKFWMSPNIAAAIVSEFKILLKEGTQAKIKLTMLKTSFDSEFTNIYDISLLTHSGLFDSPAYSQQQQIHHEPIGIQIFRNKVDGLRSFFINPHDSKGLECVVMFKRGLKKFEICENLAKRERTANNLFLLTQDNFYTNPINTEASTYLQQKNPPIIQDSLNHILKRRSQMGIHDFPRKQSALYSKQYIRQMEPPYLDYNQLNSLECHPLLPFFLIGGKSNIEVAHLSTLKNFDRLKTPQLGEIVKLHSSGQRIGASDAAGNLGIYHFEPKFAGNCVYNLKKAGVVDFSFIKPSVLAVLNSTTVQIYDTLLHPKRQLRFKQSFSREPLAVSSIEDNRIAVLNKNELLFYDIRMERLEGTRQLKGKGKSLLVQGRKIFVGQTDSKVRLFKQEDEEYKQSIKLGQGEEREREKIGIQQMTCYEDVVVAMTSQGSLYYLPPF